MAKDKKKPEKEEKTDDKYREPVVRYFGYASHIADALRFCLPSPLITLAYACTTGYIFADVMDKSIKSYDKNKDEYLKVAIDGGDAFLWQMMATILFPGLIFGRASYYTCRLSRRFRLKNSVAKLLPPILTLAIMPFVIQPIDSISTCVMDNTYRKVFDGVSSKADDGGKDKSAKDQKAKKEKEQKEKEKKEKQEKEKKEKERLEKEKKGKQKM